MNTTDCVPPNSPSPIIGIDLGTTNSEVAVVHEGKVKVLLVDNARLMPSVLSLSASNEILIGKVAENNELAFPEQTIRAIKRKMGSQEEIRVGEYLFTPPMISSLLLKRLKLAAEAFLQQPVTRAVITVPALFNEQQREATKEAAVLAGLEPVRLLNEPTAAALAYSLGKNTEGCCLVYDLGGGTFDVSIVDFSKDLMEVRASHGDTHLGGVDFDTMIAQQVRQAFLTEHGIDLKENARSWARLMHSAEQAKIRLSKEAEAEICEEFIAEKEGVALHVRHVMKRHVFEEMIRPTILRSMESVRSALQQANLQPNALDRVILVGGSTYIPLISEYLERELKITPQATLNPSLVVAMGAAVEAANLEGKRVGPMMVDITPHSLGIDCLNAEFDLVNHILIRRNTPLPYTASHVFYKVSDMQKKLNITVYQGESTIPALNQSLGVFELEEMSAADREIYVKFELDRSGLLRVTVMEMGSGKQISRVLHKQAKTRLQRSSLSDLETIRIATEQRLQDEDEADESDAKESGNGNVVIPSAQRFSINPAEDGEIEISNYQITVDTPEVEDFIKRAHKLVESGTLEASDKDELTQMLTAIRSGDVGSQKRLEDLVYYLE